MGKSTKERHEFKSPDYDGVSACNIYLLKEDNVHYFGIEDIGEGISISRSIAEISKFLVKKYKSEIDNSFFLQWYKRYPNRGVEIVEFKWKGNIPNTPSVKKFCESHENPFL
jgi:hypothetical protein